MTMRADSAGPQTGWFALVPMRIGALLALLTLLFGFGLGMAFGLVEDAMKESLNTRAMETLSGHAEAGQEAKALAGRAWTYMKRAHLHANGLGTAALAMIVLMSVVPASSGLRKVTSLLLGLGALGYSVFWLWAAQRTPALGSTSAAKESLRWLAMPSSAFCLLGLVLVIWVLVAALARRG